MLILASGSPRRKELLKKLVLDFEVMPSLFDEEFKHDLTPEVYAMRCAEGKADDIYAKRMLIEEANNDLSNNDASNKIWDFLHSESIGKPNSKINALAEESSEPENKRRGLLVLGADTVVVAGGRILGKPSSPKQAKEMLRAVCGAEHKVITGICLINNGIKTKAFDRTILLIDSLTESEIDEYVDGGSPLDKAGAYGLQDEIINDKLKYIRGSRDNVIGLPTELLSRLLPRGINNDA